MSMNVKKKSGRPRLVSREELAKIMFSVFAAKGYEATSLNDLTSATGTKPATLYQAFENKEGMYIAALQHYKATWLAGLGTIINAEHLSLGEKMKQFLRAAFTVFSCEGKPSGCMLVFSALSFHPADSALGESLLHERNAFRAWLVSEAEKARPQCTLAPEEFAEFIFALESGLALLALDAPDLNTINKMIDKVIDGLCQS